MLPKTKILLTLALVLGAWILGFVMGGALRSGPAGAAGTLAEAERAAALAAERGEIAGHSEQAKSQTSSPERKLPWDRERLQRVTASIAHEGSIANFFRHSMQMMDQWEAEDFPLVMQVMEESAKENDLSEMLVFSAVARWAELDPKAAADYLVKNGKLGGWIDINGPMLWSVWGANDPTAAVAYAKGMESSTFREKALKEIVESLARVDADNALTFAKIHAPDLLAKGEFSQGLAKGAGRADPERVARRLASIEGTASSSDSEMQMTAGFWAAKDRATALSWAQSLSNPSTRAAALAGIYDQWLTSDPKSAATAALTESRNGVDFETIANLGVNKWPDGDWTGAANWAGQLPTEKERTIAHGALGERLGNNDTKAGAQWLSTLAPGPERDAAIARYTYQTESADAPTAIEWSLTISDAPKRKESAQQLVKSWFVRAPAEAFEWLQNNRALTPEQKLEILR